MNTDMPLVLVEWVDIESEAGWQDFDDASKKKGSQCEGVGYIVFEDKDVIVLAQNISMPLILGIHTYPRGCVKSIKVLRIGGDYKRGRKK